MKKIILTLIGIILLSSFSKTLQASQFPRFLGNEKKFRAYVYNPNDVYRYVGHYTYQGFIEFGETETISTISMGDTSLWLFEYLGNRLFLKPIAQNADTNMTVITNEKVYHFELTAKVATSIDDKDLIFVVKFIYPDEKDKNIMQFPKTPKSDEPDMRDLSIYNFNYQFTGEMAIAPVKVFDNGVFTYLQFATANPELPAIFSVDSAGYEELVNFRIAGDYVIIERVAAQFTLRNGADIVCVYNDNVLSSGRVAPVVPVSKRNIPNPAYSGSGANPTPGFATPGIGGRSFDNNATNSFQMPTNPPLANPNAGLSGAMPIPPAGGVPFGAFGPGSGFPPPKH